MVQSKKIALTVDDLPIHGDKIESYSRLEIAKNFIQAFKKFDLPPVVGFANMQATLDSSEGLEVIHYWSESGHLLGNHTFSHLDLECVSEGEFINDIELNEKYLSCLPHFKRYFRYPFLSESQSFIKRAFVKEYLENRNYIVAPVTVDFFDFMWNTAFSKCLAHKNGTGKEYLQNTFITAAAEAADQSILTARKIFSCDVKQIMLLHMGMATSLFIEPLIEHLMSLGYEFITLEEALSDELYQEDFYIPERNGLNFLQQAAQAYHTSMPPYSETLKKQVLRYAYNLPSTISL